MAFPLFENTSNEINQKAPILTELITRVSINPHNHGRWKKHDSPRGFLVMITSIIMLWFDLSFWQISLVDLLSIFRGRASIDVQSLSSIFLESKGSYRALDSARDRINNWSPASNAANFSYYGRVATDDFKGDNPTHGERRRCHYFLQQLRLFTMLSSPNITSRKHNVQLYHWQSCPGWQWQNPNWQIKQTMIHPDVPSNIDDVLKSPNIVVNDT